MTSKSTGTTVEETTTTGGPPGAGEHATERREIPEWAWPQRGAVGDMQIPCGVDQVGQDIAVDREHHSRRKAAQGRPA
jgi:hypothetical protein